MGILVSLDGLDGSGKTTVALLLAADGSFHYYKSPGGPFASLRAEVDLHATPLERYCFYRLATQFDSVQIGRLLETESVVADRYIASTAAYHFAMDDRIRDIHNEDGVIRPNFAFFLDVRSDVRDERIRERNKISSDRKLENNSGFLDQVAEVFASMDLIRIDTTSRTIQEVVAMVNRIIRKGEPP